MHLAPRPGTHMALMSALLHKIIANDQVDSDYLAAHAAGFEELAELVAGYTREVAADICDVPAAQFREAAALRLTTPPPCTAAGAPAARG